VFTIEAEYDALSLNVKDLLSIKLFIGTVPSIVSGTVPADSKIFITVWEDNSGGLTLVNLQQERTACCYIYSEVK
jgi:hypothetical protein